MHFLPRLHLTRNEKALKGMTPFGVAGKETNVRQSTLLIFAFHSCSPNLRSKPGADDIPADNGGAGGAGRREFLAAIV